MSFAMLARESESTAPSTSNAFSKSASSGLRVGDANSVHEQEADRVADEVMAGETPRIDWSLSSMHIGSSLQRKCACDGSSECTKCRGTLTVRRKADGAMVSGEAPPIVHEVLSSPGRPLDRAARNFFEPRFARDFSRVRIHTGRRAAESASVVDATAYSVGHDLVFADDSLSVSTNEGCRLIAHELTHVVQQGSDRSSTKLAPYTISSTADPAETEADRIAGRVVAGDRAQIVEQATAGLYRNASPQDEQQKAEAKKNHEEEQAKIADLIAQMRALKSDPSKGFEDPDNLLQNSLQWLPAPGESAGASAQISLTILSPTHDKDTRDSSQGRAFFDPRVEYPAIGGDYPADSAIKTDSGLKFKSRTLQGAEATTEFKSVKIFTDIFLDFDALRKILIHELQHVADQSTPSTSMHFGSSNPLLAAVEEAYKTEFRAFWIQPEPTPPPRGAFVPSVSQNFGSSQEPASNTQAVTVKDSGSCKLCTAGKQTVRTKFKNNKQEKIFWYLLEEYKFDQFDCFYICSPDFRDMANNFVVPESVNLVNSVRIQALSDALQGCTQQMSLGDLALLRVITTAKDLDAIDRQFLRDQRSRPLWSLANVHLPGDLLGMITSLIKTGKMVSEAPGDYEPPHENAQRV